MVLKPPDALVRFVIICPGMSVMKFVNTRPVGLRSAESQPVVMSSPARGSPLITENAQHLLPTHARVHALSVEGDVRETEGPGRRDEVHH